MSTPLPADEATPVATVAPDGHVIHLYRRAPASVLAAFPIDDGFGAVFRTSRLREELLRIAQRDDGIVVLAVSAPNLIVGYILVERPVPVAWQRRVTRSRWEENPVLYELGAMEVSRKFRRLRLADAMLGVLLSDPELQDKIVIASVMRRYWDIAGSGMDIANYRTVLLHLMERHGFAVFATNDRDVISDPTNALVAWFGPNTGQEDIALFHELRVRL